MDSKQFQFSVNNSQIILLNEVAESSRSKRIKIKENEEQIAAVFCKNFAMTQ